MRNQVFKKLFSVLLALIMVAGLLPASVLAEGEGNADSTPAPTEAVQPTESAEPTEPTKTETPEVTEVPEPTPENPAATVEPTQGEPTAEPTDEGIMVADLYAAGKNGVELVEKWLNPSSTGITHPSDGFYDGFYRIMFIDNGRKYFSVVNIKQLIDNASAAGFNYLQLAVGNDGMRFLLDDMSLTVNGIEYTSEQVSAAIHEGNEAYHNFDVDELTQSDMDTIIAYANAKGMGVIPCVNTPGHMDAILYAASKLTGTNCSYSGSARTIDVTNATAVEFTQALLQKYITYFAGKGCKLFNIGADEYANDRFTTGSMGFGNLQSTGKYSYYVQYVNQVAAMVKQAGMIPMAFNDGIYFANNTKSGTFDTDILICYWSNGWSSYSPMPVSDIVEKGFEVINAHGDYYWVLGKTNWQCSPEKAKGFDYKQFQGGTVNNPAGAMFLIWCDYPGADTDANVISKTAATIAAFGATLPKPESTDITVTDETTGVAVTAKGLSKITVEAVTAPTISEAAENKVLAYTIALTGENGAIESGKVTVSFPIPAGWDTNKLRGFAVQQTQTRAGAAPETIEGRVEDSNYVFDVTLPVESVGIYQLDAATTEKIDLTVNGEVTREQEGNQTIDPAVTLDTNIATVKVEHHYQEESTTTEFKKVDVTQISGSQEGYIEGYIHDGTNYLKLTGDKIDSTTKKDEATKFTVTKSGNNYTIKSGSYYLTISGSGWFGGYSLSASASSSTWSYDANNGFYQSLGIYRDYYYLVYSVYSNGWTVSTSSNNPGYLYNDVTTTEPGVDKTVITFTGVAVGTTSVKVGDVTYNIEVSDKAPEGSLTADSITLEYWITNNMVYDGQTASTNHTKTITKNTQGIETDDGVDMTTLAPNPAYSFFDGTVTVYYWQTMRLDKEHKQTKQADVDQTAAGTRLTHIRYRNGAWQYKTLDNTWHYFQSGDQLVAYYLQKTDVTKEIDTYAKDWGYGTGSTTPDTSSNKGQVALTVAVVYPDGTVSPAEANMYSSSTTIFNYWENRDIGIVAPVTKGDYTISKITVTDGMRTEITTANVWYTSDTITWNKKTLDSGAKWYDETVVWDKATNSGTTPMANGAQSNIRWSKKNTAKLVLIYIEPVVSEDNLNVVYWDDSAAKQINPNGIQVVVTKGTTFTNGLKDGNGTVIGGTANWPGKKPEDSGYLPDDAYVTNSSDVNQTFNKDITIIDGVAANYRSGIYEYVGANISENGKTLTLHYNLKKVDSLHRFVVDFGLPVTFTDLLSWFHVNDATTVEYLSVSKTNKLTESTGSWGSIKIDETTWNSMTYTLDKMLSASATIPLYCKLVNGSQIETQIQVIPATNVYYEDSFAKFYGSDGTQQTQFNATGTDDTPGVWYIDGQEKTATQALEALGEKTNHNVYGYDPAYQDSTMFSMGSARKVTVNTNGEYAQAKFTFKGTGFDVISLTNNKSGAITVEVLDSTGRTAYTTANKKAFYLVNNYYGYTYNSTTGEWTASPEIENALYQVPVIRVRDLEYGQEYTAVITVDYADIFNKTGDGKYSFWLDAVRVYDPAGPSLNTEYVKDKEGYPQYIKLRDELAKEDGSVTVDSEKLLFIDGAENAAISLYKNYGPNNEVYLAKGQAITFKLAGTDLSKIETVQIGAKAPMSGGIAKLSVNGTGVVEKELSSATEMYYDISAVKDGRIVTITNTGEAILSLTNLKITYTEKGSVSLGAMNAEEQTASVMAVRALFAPAPVEPEPEPEPEKTFEPERFEASWSRNVMQGRKATLTVKTSEDVEAITVDGQTIRSYRTRTERMGFGRRAKRITYREFTYSMVAQESADFSVTAVNAEGTESEAITARLTVQKRPRSIRDVWNWFKGWF
ncbi:MAG: family 20 glycosylhydrolase [Christensenellaceae bacterium]|nr:family 20 glycosylhydrolase [Christensenellaceae bacterium]